MKPIEPVTAPRLCPTCAPADARVVWIEGEKRGRLQHRRHCPHYDAALAGLISAQERSANTATVTVAEEGLA